VRRERFGSADPNDPLVIANVVHQFADHEEPGERLEGRLKTGIVPVARLYETDRRNLLEIRAIQAVAIEFSRSARTQIGELGDKPVTIFEPALFVESYHLILPIKV
jgi:hypothetical protein